MRAVLDANVIISAVLSPRGTPGRIFRHWLEGAFELVVSAALLDELERALAYPRLAEHISPSEAESLIQLLRRAGAMHEDPSGPPDVTSSDPDDDYLISLAGVSRSILVSGDQDLRQLAGELPVYAPVDFLTLVEGDAGRS